MARKKIREYNSKRLLKEHLKRLAGIDLDIKSAQVIEKTAFAALADKETWLNSTRLVVKPDMLFGKRGKSGLVALNLDLSSAEAFVKERLGKVDEMQGCQGPITTFIIEPSIPHDDEYYLSLVSDRLSTVVSFSECGGIEIEENWDKVKTVVVPTGKTLDSELAAPLIATLPLGNPPRFRALSLGRTMSWWESVAPLAIIGAMLCVAGNSQDLFNKLTTGKPKHPGADEWDKAMEKRDARVLEEYNKSS
ncbi:hypothetical protein R1sor_015361 [Riccia sorocarpa]|uniref:NADH dehydrogenase [ubiquinone] 1 alpha subcomplex subunit 1 n=1 Tax=Riccia sorocarpa TaxID=122646 RepID=A0ABD3HF10_9MARC